MHIIDPARYAVRRARRHWLLYILAILVPLVALGTLNYLRPLPEPTISWGVTAPPTTAAPTFSVPGGEQFAVAAPGYSILATNGPQTPLATASIAKVILALCVLQKQPLSVGQSGPVYTIGAADVANYINELAQNGSTLPVEEGEQLNEYQALEALMLPSANNIADSLVGWIFGDHTTYATYATDWLRQHGLNNTHIGTDASGYDPSTTSTASDVAQLGLLALQNPVLIQIADQSSADLPVIGTVTNYNTVLGQSGINGLKTGNNDADAGAFLFTASTTVGKQNMQLTGAVMGADSLDTALQQSVQLAASLAQGFEQATIVKSDQAIGSMHAAWGATQPILADKTLQLARWKATPITLHKNASTKVRSGTVGTLKATAGPASASTKLQLAHTLAGPSFWWRLTRH